MYLKNKAFSLIEIICATGLMLILTITVLQLSMISTSYAGKIKNEIKSRQTLDNFRDFLYLDIVINNSKILKDEESKDYLLRYTYKPFTAKDRGEREEKIKTVEFDKQRQKIYLLTKKINYKSEYKEVTEGKNVLIENVKSAKSRYEDDMVIIDIEMTEEFGQKSKSIKMKL